MIERSPRAPVSRSSARSEISQSASSVNDELDRVVAEEPLVLACERVLGLGEDGDEVLPPELMHRRDDRKPADELGDQPEGHEVFGHDLG